MFVGDVPLLDATLITLPYVDQCFSFNVLLPKTITGLANLENKLGTQNLAQAYTQLTQQYVQLQLPAFNITTSLNLNSALQNVRILKLYNNLNKTKYISLSNSLASKRLSQPKQTSVLFLTENHSLVFPLWFTKPLSRLTKTALRQPPLQVIRNQ